MIFQSLCLWQQVLIAIYIMIEILVILFIRKMLKDIDKSKFIVKDISEKEKAFLRDDYDNWNIFEIYFVGILLLFPRFMGFLIFTFLHSIIVKFVTFFEKKQPYSRLGSWIIRISSKFFMRLVTFCCGFVYISERSERIQEFYKDYQGAGKTNAPILVYNHVSFMDVIYLLHSQFSPSFISKIDVKSYPMIGSICTGTQGIYIKREQKEDRDSVLYEIKNRIEKITSGQNYPMLAIAPEGTTTNGKQLISFKKGSFVNLNNLQIVCLNYHPRNFRISMDEMNMAYTFILGMCQLYNVLQVTNFDVFVPQNLPQLKQLFDSDASEDEKWKLYAQKVKDLMANTLKISQSESGYSDKRTYLLKINEQLQQNKGKKKQ